MMVVVDVVVGKDTNEVVLVAVAVGSLVVVNKVKDTSWRLCKLNQSGVYKYVRQCRSRKSGMYDCKVEQRQLLE